MKISNNKDLVAYASTFVAYVLPKINVEEIILFGSVARGDAEKRSDIDLFFNVTKDEEKIRKDVKKLIQKFYETKFYELWRLKEIALPFNIEVGNLDLWKLKRSIISDGIMLYGKYKSMPEKTKGYVYLHINPIKEIAKRNKVIRNLFGRKEKAYSKVSLIEKLGGKKLNSSSFIVPMERLKEAMEILKSEKISYNLFEFWTDYF